MVKVHKKYLIIIQGDWNSVVDDSNDNWSNVVGRFVLGKSNQRGNLLLEFCTKHILMIVNTLHLQNNSP